MDKKKVITLVALWLLLFAVMYVRPLPIYEVLPGYNGLYGMACEVKYCTVEAGEDGKIVYKDTVKRLATSDGDDLMDLFKEEKYRQELASALYGGYRPPETQPYPRTEIRFTQGDTVYEIYVYTNRLALGPAGALRDVTPMEKETFTSAVMDFVRDHGEVVSVDIRDHTNKG